MQIRESKSHEVSHAAQLPAAIAVRPPGPERFVPLPPVLSRLVLRYLAPSDDIGASFASNFPPVAGEADRSAAEELIQKESKATPLPRLSAVMRKVHPWLHDADTYLLALDQGFDVAPDVVRNITTEALEAGNRAWFIRLWTGALDKQTTQRQDAQKVAVHAAVERLAAESDESAQRLLSGVFIYGLYTGFRGALEDAGLPAGKFPV